MAKSFEASDEIAGEALGLQAVKEVAAEVGIGRAPFEHMVEDDQQRMPDRHQGSFPTPASDQAPVFTSNARISPGALGSASGTVLPMMSKFSKTTPGVLALTDSPCTGRPSPARRSTQPLSPKLLIGRPVRLSSA